METTQGPSTDERRHKIRSIHITECRSARKKSEVPTRTTTWADPVREVKGEGTLRGREHMQRSCGNGTGWLCGTAKKGSGVAGGEGAPGGAENGGRGQSLGAEPRPAAYPSSPILRSVLLPPPQSHCTKQMRFQSGKQEALQRVGGGWPLIQNSAGLRPVDSFLKPQHSRKRERRVQNFHHPRHKHGYTHVRARRRPPTKVQGLRLESTRWAS